MATQIKTVEYYFPELAAVTDLTDTNFTQITAYLPENSKVFRSVLLDVQIEDAEITSNNTNRTQLSLSLNSGTYTVVNNTNAATSSGEQKWIPISANFTSLFYASWSGTSMTVDARVLVDNAIATPSQNWRCATARLQITYEYDDTTTTQIKTVRFPLITPYANLGTTKPGTANDTIPALNTWLPEASKTIRQITLVVEGNEEYASTVDRALVWEIDTLGTYTTGIHEGALNSSCYYRHNQIMSFSTSATHSFYIWCATASFAHPIAYLNITYEYNESTSTSILNSLLLPFVFESGIGRTTSSDVESENINLSIQEPETIAIGRSAVQFYWMQDGPITGLNFRVNTGTATGALTSTASTVAGSCAASVRCDQDITLARGQNTIKIQSFHTGTVNQQLLSGLMGILVLNYTSGKATIGSGNHNKTILHNIIDQSTVASTGEATISTNYLIPNASYFLNSIGMEYVSKQEGTGAIRGVYMDFERLSAEGGCIWHRMNNAAMAGDALTGTRKYYGVDKTNFYRFPSDIGLNRINPLTARRFRIAEFNHASRHTVNLMYTFHSLTWSASGTVSGSAGGTVTLKLLCPICNEYVLSTSRTGNGAYSFTFYNNTVTTHFIDAYEDSTHMFRSANFTFS
jgi:hypothetical protein